MSERTPRWMAVAAWTGALALSAWVIVRPLWAATYPPITDLPFHGAAISILRHWWDPAWHFQEQFQLQFAKAPYWTHYGLGAALALVMPVVAATKVSTAVLLAMLPAGLAVMFHGMGRSPLLGLAGLAFVWNGLTHWGFVNFVGALGLFCLVVGMTLLVLRRPTRARRIGLAAALLLVFSTHVFRFPLAVAAVAGTTLLAWPATRRWRPVVLPLLPSLAAFFAWTAVRDDLGAGSTRLFELHLERFNEMKGYLFHGLVGPEETSRAATSLRVGLGVAAICALGFALERRWARWSPREKRWAIGVGLLPFALAAASLGLYLTLPMEIGAWWYVYPREALSACFLLVGGCPDLPRAPALRVALAIAIGFAAARQANLVADSNAAFEQATADFRAIVRHLPRAPKLGYMIFDHGGSHRSTTPFIHLPAWVQAERGGWLSFHMASFGAMPIRYRSDPGADVPPPTPLRFEWTPERFDVATRGKYFDWFLVRQASSPAGRFRRDPDIQLVDRAGTWWLFRRVSASPQAGP